MTDVFDHIVVGGGAAGCVLAGRLTEDAGRSVLLLEAGPRDRAREIRIPAAFPRLFGTRYDWDLRTEPQPALDGRSLYWPRGRVLGGSSSINAMMHVRGNRSDYDGWAAAGAPGWAFEDLLPVFRRSEDSPRGGPPLRGRGGPLSVEELRDPNPATRAFLEAAVSAGLPRNPDVNGERQEGVDLTQVNQRRGRRWSVADAYLRPALGRPGLTVRTGARVTRVLVEGGRATGVEVLAGGSREEVRARKGVLLAAGAVGSPHLLLLSGVGPARELREAGIEIRADLPGVGLHLEDHLSTGIVVRAARPVSLVGAESVGGLLRYVLLRRGGLTSNVAEALAFVRSREGLEAPDLELLFAPAPFVDHGRGDSPGHGLTVGAILLQPRSAGRIGLRSADPLEPPRIDPAYLSSPEADAELAVLRAGLRLARRILSTSPLAELAGEPIRPASWPDGDEGMDAYIRDSAETLYHPVGSCRMGTDPEAVVDPSLRVRGVAGLHVADASVMPRIPRGHTQWPTVAIAERASDLVRGEASGL